MKFYYFDLVNNRDETALLEVHSFEMNIYLVKVTIGTQSAMVYDKCDKPMRFNSSGHIREAFATCEINNAVMVHDTPYDEMIGNPPKASQTMALPFSMALPY